MAQRTSADDGRTQIAPRVAESACRLACMESRGGGKALGLTAAIAHSALHVEKVRAYLGDDIGWPEPRPHAEDVKLAERANALVAGNEDAVHVLREAVINAAAMWTPQTLERIDAFSAAIAGWAAAEGIVGDAGAAQRLFGGIAEAAAARRLTDGGAPSLALHTGNDVMQFCGLSARELRELVPRLGALEVRGRLMERIATVLVEQKVVERWEGFYAGTRHEKAAKNSNELGLYAAGHVDERGETERALYRLRCAVFAVAGSHAVAPDLLRMITVPAYAPRDGLRNDATKHKHHIPGLRSPCPVCEIERVLKAFGLDDMLAFENDGVVSITLQMAWALRAAQKAHLDAGHTPEILLVSPGRAPNAKASTEYARYPSAIAPYLRELGGNTRASAEGAHAMLNPWVYLLPTGIEWDIKGEPATPIEWEIRYSTGEVKGDRVIRKASGKSWDLVYRSPDNSTTIEELLVPVQFPGLRRTWRLLRVKGEREPRRRTRPVVHYLCPVTLRGNKRLADRVGRLVWRVHGREEYARQIRNARRASINAANQVLSVRGRADAQEVAWELLRQIAAVGRVLRAD